MHASGDKADNGGFVGNFENWFQFSQYSTALYMWSFFGFASAGALTCSVHSVCHSADFVLFTALKAHLLYVSDSCPSFLSLFHRYLQLAFLTTAAQFLETLHCCSSLQDSSRGNP
jgi:hypothetical protein